MKMEISNNPRVVLMILIVSLVINFLFIANYSVKKINSPTGRYGILKQDIKVFFPKDGDPRQPVTVFLPKGIIVRDASPRGFDHVDLFEPYRFNITFMSDKKDVVDFSVDIKKLKQLPFYSYIPAK
jgi:hypothetical protein